FITVGVSGQNNVANAAWVATPNVIVPAGTYTVVDSGPATWSFNSGSNNSGFTRVWGFAVQASALSFVTQPTRTIANQTISPAVQVKATDSSPVPAALPFIAITISIGSNPSGGTLSGTLTQTTDATGVATFNDLSIDKAGSGYTLMASSTSPVTAASNPFSITNPRIAFPPEVVPATRLGSVFAWRIPPHSSPLPRLSCSLEPTLHSIEGNVATSIQFTNNTGGPLNVYWISYQGQRVFYRGGPFAALGAEQSYTQGTYITHPWIITDVATNSCLGIWLPTESPDRSEERRVGKECN